MVHKHNRILFICKEKIMKISDKGMGLENIILSEVVCDVKIKMSWRGPVGKEESVKIGEE